MKKFLKIVHMVTVLNKYMFFLLYCRVKKINNEKTWLISERGNDARDNSYWLFKYIRKNHPEIDIRYIIDKKSVDYKKIKELGECIEFGSKDHYIMLISSGVLISTHIMGYTPDMSLFCRLDRLGLARFYGKRIFIQHGIMKDKMMELPNFDLMISGGKTEYTNLVKMMPAIKEKIKFTGLARFDSLPHKHKPTKRILLMPTFRRWTNYYDDSQFEETKYYKAFQDMISCNEIESLLSKYGYEMIFYPHIEAQKRLHLFKPMGKHITIAYFDKYDVQELLISSDLLITDYSSVFFDFGYMQKPMFYYQFDKIDYFSKHYDQGYFKYERDGFGRVVENRDDMLALLEYYLKNGCKIEDKYKRKSINFFGTIDNNNCKRIYEEITKVADKNE